MAIVLLAGQCIGLDAHLSDLLDIYTRARNRVVREQLQEQYPGEEERPLPDEVTSERVACCLLQQALEERLMRLGVAL